MAKKVDVWTNNFAADERVRDAVRKTIIPKMKEVRNNRQSMENDWIRYYNMWNVVHDSSHTYSGRAKLYIPEVRKNVESQARQLTEAMFPNDDFLSVSPGSSGTRKGAEIQRSIRLWQIDQAQLRVKMHVFNRQECLYGTSPAYVCWSKKVEHAFRRARDPKTGKIKLTRELIELYNGPDFIVRDLFKWYALNPKKQDILEDGTVDFVTENHFDLVAQAKQGYLYGLDKIEQGNSSAYRLEELERDIERAETLGLQIENQSGYAGVASLEDKDADEKHGTHLVATVYTRLVLPQACLEEEDPELGIPVKIKIYDGEHVGFVGRNPFFHQRPPYVVGKYILPNADEFYGQGIPQAIQYMQYEANSKAEQAMDSATLALNPIAFIDPALASQANDFEIEPGATWFINPAGVKLAAMPDVSATGYNAIEILRRQMADYSDRSPALPTQLQGKSRSATQSEIVDRAQSVDNKTFQLQNEILVLNPLMEMWEYLTDQNIEEDQVIMLLGRRATDWKRVLLTKNMTLGRYQYFWKASSSLQNRQIMARQMIDMMKVAGSLPPQEQMKLNMQYSELVKILWTEMFQLPDADKVLGQPEEMMAQSPEVIHKMLKLGMEVEILPNDDDKSIISFLSEKINNEKDEWVKKEMMRQILLHQVQIQKKQLLQKMQVEQMREQIAAEQQAQGGGESSGTQGSGNRTQLSPNANAGNMASGMRA